MPIAAWRDAVGHFEIVGPDTSGHVGDADDIARRERRKARADQVEIGDAIDLIVVGDAAVAIAEADLRPHVDLDVGAAGGPPQRKARPAGQPSRGKRPGDFPPAPPLSAAAHMLIGRSAGQRTERHDHRPQ